MSIEELEETIRNQNAVIDKLRIENYWLQRVIHKYKWFIHNLCTLVKCINKEAYDNGWTNWQWLKKLNMCVTNNVDAISHLKKELRENVDLEIFNWRITK